MLRFVLTLGLAIVATPAAAQDKAPGPTVSAPAPAVQPAVMPAPKAAPRKNIARDAAKAVLAQPMQLLKFLAVNGKAPPGTNPLRGLRTKINPAPPGFFDALIATHAQANGVPETLIHKVIKRESKYDPAAVGHGGALGLMQIKPATARSLGYDGPREGLLDPATNLTYAVRYLAGAFRAANGNPDRAYAYFRTGYFKSRRTGAVVTPRESRAAAAAAAEAAALSRPAADVAAPPSRPEGGTLGLRGVQ